MRAEDGEEHGEDGDNKVCRKGIKVIRRRMCVRSMRMAMMIGMRMVTIRCVRKGMDIGQLDKVMTIRRRLLHMSLVTIRCG